jgi:hypothetical protein
MRKFLTLCAILLSLSASAQWQLTGSRVRYVNGIGIPTRDTSAMTPADSSQILIRPADSSLYVKYKRTWQKVGSGGGGTVTGSGTTNYVPKFTSSTAIGNSQIFDNGTSVGIGTASPSNKVDIFTTNRTALNTVGSGLNVNYNGSTTGQFATLGFSWNSSVGNNSTQWGMGMIGTNFVSGNADVNFFTDGVERMRITSAGNVGIDYTAPAAKLAVNGTALINTNTDNGVDKLQVSGSMSVSARATAQNLSVTNNISVTNDINQGSGTANANWTILANNTSSGWAGRMVGEYATGQFYFQHRNNSPTFTTCFSLNANGGKGYTDFYDNAFIRGDGWLTVNGSTNNGVDKLRVIGSVSATGMQQAYLARTTTYTATTSDYFIDCTTGTFTVNLFTAVGNTGRILIIKNSGTGTITVDPNGSQTIDGATTQTLSTQWSRVHIISDGANWKIISN